MFKLVKIESSVRVLNIPAGANQQGFSGNSAAETAPAENPKQQICVIRGKRVMLDEDAAGLYGVGMNDLNRQVKKNIMRFSNNYMFQLTDAEYDSLRSQIAALKTLERRKQPPHAFTERGVVMLSMILDSYKALEMSFLAVEGFIIADTAAADNKAEAGSRGIGSILRTMAAAGNKQDKKYGFGTDEDNIVQDRQHGVVYGQQH